jgi:prefoldin subunit 5
LAEKTFEKEINDLRERVIRLEVQITEMNKRVEALSSYTRQLYEYLAKLGK